MFTPARLAVGLEPLSVPGVKRRKPHPFRNDGTELSVSPLIAPQRVIWQTKLSLSLDFHPKKARTA